MKSMQSRSRSKVNIQSSRPQSNLYFGSKRHSKETSSSNQNFSNRPWTSNQTRKYQQNQCYSSSCTHKLDANNKFVNSNRAIQNDPVFKQQSQYFQKIVGFTPQGSQGLAQTPKNNQKKELFGNQLLKQKKTSMIPIQQSTKNTKSPTAQTNATGTTGTVRFLSKAMDAAAYHHGQTQGQHLQQHQPTMSKKRIIFTSNNQKRPQTSIRMDKSGLGTHGDRLRPNYLHNQTKSYESVNFLNRNSSQIEFSSSGKGQNQSQFRKNLQMQQSQIYNHLQGNTLANQSSQTYLLLSKRQNTTGQQSTNMSGGGGAPGGKNLLVQDSSRSLLEYYDRQSNQNNRNNQRPPMTGGGIRMRKVKMVDGAIHAKRQTVPDVPVVMERAFRNTTGRATPSFLTSQQAIEKYRKVQSVTPCIITDETVSQRGFENKTAFSGKQRKRPPSTQQKFIQYQDSFEHRSRSTMAGGIAGHVYMANNENNMSQENLQSSQEQKVVVLNNASLSQINASVFSTDIMINNHDTYNHNPDNISRNDQAVSKSNTSNIGGMITTANAQHQESINNINNMVYRMGQSDSNLAIDSGQRVVSGMREITRYDNNTGQKQLYVNPQHVQVDTDYYNLQHLDQINEIKNSKITVRKVKQVNKNTFYQQQMRSQQYEQETTSMENEYLNQMKGILSTSNNVANTMSQKQFGKQGGPSSRLGSALGVQEKGTNRQFDQNNIDYDMRERRVKQSSRNSNRNTAHSIVNDKIPNSIKSINQSQRIKQIKLKSRNMMSQQFSNNDAFRRQNNNINFMPKTKIYNESERFKNKPNEGVFQKSRSKERSQSRKRNNTGSNSPARTSPNRSEKFRQKHMQQSISALSKMSVKRYNQQPAGSEIMLHNRKTTQEMQSQRVKYRSRSPQQTVSLEQTKRQKIKQMSSFKQVSINITPRIPQMNQKERHEVVEHNRLSIQKQKQSLQIAKVSSTLGLKSKGNTEDSHKNTISKVAIDNEKDHPNIEENRLILPDGRVLKTVDKNSDENLSENQEVDMEIQDDNEFIYDQCNQVKELNQKLDDNLGSLSKLQNYMENYDPEYEKLKLMDANQVLQDASKQIKVIKYECNNAIVQEDQRHIMIKTPGPFDGTKPGSETVIDIIENCPLACKIETYGRRIPMYLHLNYSYNLPQKESNPYDSNTSPIKSENFQTNNTDQQANGIGLEGSTTVINDSGKKQSVMKIGSKQRQATMKQTLRRKLRKNLPELTFCFSDNDKLPTPDSAFQVVKNPGTKFILKYDRNMSTMESDKRVSFAQKSSVSKNHYDFQYLYINITCEQSCTIGVSCSFPEQIRDVPRGAEGSLGEEGMGLSTRVNEKDFRQKIKLEVKNQMEELLDDMKKQKEYFTNLEKMKKEQQVVNVKHTDVNFIQRNTNVEEILDEYQHKFINNREISIIRTQQAIIKKQSLEEERLDKIRFDMLKWDLYRIKCEDIDERYAQFKKIQLKVFWWNQIIARHRMAKKAKWNFDEHLKKVITAARNMLKAFKIQYHFKKYMLCFGPNKQSRDRNKVRNILTLLHLAKCYPPKDRAQSVIYKFLYKRQVEQNMQAVFRNFYITANKINLKLKDIRMARECKKDLILHQFNRELNILQKHYLEKSRVKGKNKKEMQKRQLDLMNLRTENRDIVLKYYYDFLVGYTNIKVAIHWCAIDAVNKGKRALEQNFTDEEFNMLQRIEEYIKIVQEFLFKGTKDQKPLGEPPYDDDLYPLYKDDEKAGASENHSSQLKNGGKDHMGGASDDSGAEEEDEGAQGEAQGPDEGGGSKKRLVEKDPSQQQQINEPKQATSTSPGKTQKRTSRSETVAGIQAAQTGGPSQPYTLMQPPKAATKSRDKSQEKGGKGGKKKKAQKQANQKIENIIDMEMNPQRNKYIPSRSMMQRLVMRASILDPRDVQLLPPLEEIRPWIKRENQDIF